MVDAELLTATDRDVWGVPGRVVGVLDPDPVSSLVYPPQVFDLVASGVEGAEESRHESTTFRCEGEREESTAGRPTDPDFRR